MVVADILRFAEGHEPTTVRVVQGLGRPGVASVEIAAIKAKPLPAEEQAKALAAFNASWAAGEAERKKRYIERGLIEALEALTVIAGTMGPQTATLTLSVDGQHHTKQVVGNGPVDAIFNAIKALAPHDATLELYKVHAVTEGTDAQAEVSVRLSEAGRSVTGRGADPDTLVASARAYVAALEKLMARRQKGAPAPIVARIKP